MTNYEDAIQEIENQFETDGKRTIKVLRNETSQEMESPKEVREPLADYLEYMYENPADKKITTTFHLTPVERIKALITGKIDADVTAIVEAGVGFGIDWQTEDIVNLLKEKSS